MIFSRPGPLVELVGTNHEIQTTCPSFRLYLENLCRDLDVLAIAEEMNNEALLEWNSDQSIPQEVAKSLKLQHRFCDPDTAEREKLMIFQEPKIRVLADVSETALPESEIDARVAESHARRERYWLKQLRDLDLWPVLFVCGADHVTSFLCLLNQQGITARIQAADWECCNCCEPAKRKGRP